MSIFTRLYDIAKANINDQFPNLKARLGNRGQAEENHQRTWRRHKTRWEHHESGYGQQAHEEPQSHEDPKLAQYYANLEVPYGSDLETCKKAWKQLLRKYHPDRHARDPEKRAMAEELTQNLNLAWSELEKHLGKS